MTENYSELRIIIKDENGAIVRSENHPRAVAAVLAIQAGLSTEEVQQLLQLPDDKLIEMLNVIDCRLRYHQP